MPDEEHQKPYVSPYIAIRERLLALACEEAEKHKDELTSPSSFITIERIAFNGLMMAAFDAIRAEWYDAAKNAGLEHELAVAKKLMAADHYDGEQDPVCGMPGMVAFVATVDGKAAVCYEMSMAQIMPLSAYYTDKVRQAIEIAAQVGELVAAKESRQIVEAAARSDLPDPTDVQS